MDCIDCGQEILNPNSYRQNKCNQCRFKKPLARTRTSGIPNPIKWNQVPEKFGPFEINTIGTVRSISAILTPNSRGEVRLKWQGQDRCIGVGRLLLLTFNPINNPECMSAIPKNGNFHDYRLENWEWQKKGQHNAARHLNKEKAEQIKETYFKDTTLSQQQLAYQHGVSQQSISAIVNGKKWR